MDYQVGGSLAPDAPSYVERHADRQLYRSLLDGQFCYVLTSRQMGKSSLLVRTRARLQREGCRCATLDLGAIGCEGISPSQWYKGIVAELWRGFELFGDGNFQAWWQQVSELGTIQKLRGFLDELLRHRFSGERLFIFIDEVDSILNLEFSVDDFFALIRFCHEYRAIDPNYNRLTFAIFGVATPSDLIRDKSRTPFNIGTAIALEGFTLKEAEPLVLGLAFGWGNERAVLREILAQTSGQPFLTQKLCQLARERLEFQTVDGKISPAQWIAEIVRDRLVCHWESQDEPEHLRTIRDRLLRNEERSSRLLGLYQQILQAEIADNSPEALELILSGLLIKKDGILRVKNCIYRQIFTREWVEIQLQNLRPYWQTLAAWVASQERDESRLLRGKALAEARSWSQGKRLSDLDYRFLAASQEFDRREWQKKLEADRAAEMALRLDRERKVARLQRILLGVVSLAFAIAAALGFAASAQYQQVKLSQIEAIATSSDALFADDRRLDALVAAIQAQKSVQKLNSVPPDLRDYTDKVLRQAVYDILEFNRLSGQDSRVWGVAFSPTGDRIATANGDNTVKLWQSDGKLLATLSEHLGPVWGVAFSPNGKIVASASWDKTVKLWDLEGKLRSTLTGHRDAVWDVAFSPDGKTIASASEDKTVKLWSIDGKLLRTLEGHGATVWDVAFSPDGKTIASASEDKTVKLWSVDGKLLRTLEGHGDRVGGVAFSPDGKILASTSDDRTVKLWSADGTLLRTLEGHGAAVWKVAFSPDGKTIASASWDGTVRLWQPNGRAIAILEGHGDRVRDVAFSPDGRVLASASEDRTVKLWKWDGAFLHVLNGHQAGVIAVSFSRDGRTLASASDDNTVKLWSREGEELQTFKGHDAGVLDVAFSPDGKTIASASWDRTIGLWRLDGTQWRTLKGDTPLESLRDRDPVWGVAFSPDGKTIASGNRGGTISLRQIDSPPDRVWKGHDSEVRQVTFSPNGDLLASASLDGTVKLWQLDGKLLRTILPTGVADASDGHAEGVTSVAFAPDGKTIASASLDKTIKLWNRNGKLLQTLNGHREGVLTVAFSPDGKTIASASLDKTIKLWNRNGKLLQTLNGHDLPVWDVAFSPDGQTLASASEDRTIGLWHLEPILNADLLAYACDWVRDYLGTNANVAEEDRALCKS